MAKATPDAPGVSSSAAQNAVASSASIVAVPSGSVAASPAVTSGPVVPSASASAGDGKKRYVAYWSIWAKSTLPPSDAQLEGVTHLVLAFVDMTTGTPVWAAGESQFLLSDVQKIQAKGIKIMVAVGGWNLDSAFRPAVQTNDTRKAFAASVITFAQAWGFDGIDLDWEYPVDNGQNYKLPLSDPLSRQYNETDAPLFVELAKEFRTQLDTYGKTASKTMSLSAAVPARHVDMIAYNMTGIVEGLDQSLDWWNVMSYDFINRRDSITQHHAGGMVISDNYGIYHGSLGISPDKINIGYPMYSKYFQIKDGCTAVPPIGCEMGVPYEGSQGEDLLTSGTVTFNTATNANDSMVSAFGIVDQNNFRDTNALASATINTVNGTNFFWTWVSEADVEESCSKYISQVGGVFIWSINQDNRGQDGGDHIDKIAACVKAAN